MEGNKRQNYYITRDSGTDLGFEHDSFFEAVSFASDWLQKNEGKVEVFEKRNYRGVEKLCCTLRSVV
jgi:hypothetical protein